MEKKITAVEIAELCEKTAYERKGENILRLDMTNVDGAQSDQYIICTGLSEPHVGAISERIQRNSEMSSIFARLHAMELRRAVG